MYRLGMKSLRSGALLLPVFVGIAAFPRVAQSQATATNGAPSATLDGDIVDRRSDDPVPSARINLVRASDGASVWSGTSDEDGSFRTNRVSLGAYRLEVEAPPFLNLTEPVTLSEAGTIGLHVEMVGVDYELEPIVALARRSSRLEQVGFYRRLAQGTGDFVTREEIETRMPPSTSDLLRPLTSVILAGGTDSPGGPEIFLRGRGRQGANPSQPGCVPLFFLDGSPMPLSGPWGLDNIVLPENLEAIEVHRGAFVPAGYAGLTDCGVVMLWTRDPSATGVSGWLPSWKKLGVVGGLVGLSILLSH